mmetsp:Transcript_32801/g.51426  ORF Transcript_32801/g.51426 Transcript_32801/m.51426 type:complete len:80 (-) Transcript_32801:376-615(-)
MLKEISKKESDSDVCCSSICKSSNKYLSGVLSSAVTVNNEDFTSTFYAISLFFLPTFIFIMFFWEECKSKFCLGCFGDF